MPERTGTLIDRPKLRVSYRQRTRDMPMGRFGGGWQWAVGFEAGPTTVIFNLLVLSVRFHFPHRRRR